MPGELKQYAGRYIASGGTRALSLPPELRQAMGLVKGDYVNYAWNGDILIVRRVTRSLIVGGHSADVRSVQSVKG